MVGRSRRRSLEKPKTSLCLTLQSRLARPRVRKTTATLADPARPPSSRRDDRTNRERYVAEEEARGEDAVRRCVEDRENTVAMMRAHYKRRGLGKYIPPPAPAWMRGEASPPWRKHRDRPLTRREAIEGLDHDLKMRTLSWWHAIDLRLNAVERDASKRAAAAAEWGAEAGEQAVRTGAGVFARPTGHAGGVSCELAPGGDRGVDSRTIAETLATEKAARRAYVAATAPGGYE